MFIVFFSFMKQFPSRLKYKKNFISNDSYLLEQKIFLPYSGFYGLKCLEPGRLSYKEIESARRTIRRNIPKFGNLWVNVFPGFSLTKKAVSSRMGSGKGNHFTWICLVKKGLIIYEVSNLSEEISLRALSMASSKLSVKTIVVRLIY